MRVYISMDAEGISGIYNFQQVLPGGMDYEYCRKLMAGDINAAAMGAFAAGASEVFVNDGHNYGNNLMITDLDERIILCSGTTRPLSMAQGSERGYDAAMLIGYHARRGAKGVIAHSFAYGSMVELTLNGKIISEFELIGHVCGHYGTPVVFVSGDDETVKNAQQSVPGIYSVVTKECVSDNAAVCLHPAKTAALIQENVALALKNYKQDGIKPLTVNGTVELDVRFVTETQAELAMKAKNVHRLCSHTVRITGSDYLEAYRTFFTCTNLAASFKA